MLCDSCRKADAVVHLTKIENGKRTELHLCAACAEKEGILINGKDIEAWGNNFFGKTAPGDDEVAVTAEVTCPKCGMTFADFNRTGLFGCSACYTAFSEEIQPVLRRIHGHVRHVGNVPVCGTDVFRTKAHIKKLRRELKLMVAQENYEEAARIRDEIKALSFEGGEDRV